MVTMLDCIKRTPGRGNIILDKALENTEALAKAVGNFSEIREVILIGSGSSFNASLTELNFIERVTGLQANAYMPNDFAKKSVYEPKGIYVFVSQSGTSTLVREQIEKINALGYVTVSTTDDAGSPIANAARVHVPLEVGNEEFGYRTVGFSSTMLTLKVIALRIGLENGHISKEEFDKYIEDGRKALAHHNEIVEDSLKWFERNQETLKGLRALMYFGGGNLHGIAVEGALKLMETPKLYLAFGYEAEDGIHGPCYAFRKGDA
ncbi:MAG: SIS domain-containing protein, partial [Erysipelotrichaceae bacterium]|nr:SIS domain-containing protein [Erysipelotrichaceae bacterium]